MRQRKTLIPPTSFVGTTLLATGPVIVPADYVGVHIHRWPVGTPLSSPPTHINYGTWRSHDSDGSQWSDLNPSSGVFDWTKTDAMITEHRSAGKSVMFTVFGTPTWAATATGATKTNIYGRLGGSDKPQDLATLSAFVTALVTRYNSIDGVWRVANPTLGKGIKYIDSWNEPEFFPNGTETWSTNSFFWRSAGDMVDMTETIRAAAKAVDSTITIIGPGFYANALFTRAVPWMNATGPVTGKTGIQSCDAAAFHPYSAQPYGVDGVGTDQDGGLIAYRQALNAAGAPGMPIYLTEFGISDGPSQPLTQFLESSASDRRARIGRVAIMAAILEAKMFCFYALDSLDYLSGDLMTDTDGAVAGFNDAASIAGTTLTDAHYLPPDGRISVKVDGVRHIF